MFDKSIRNRFHSFLGNKPTQAYCCGPGWKILGDIAFCDTHRPCCPGFEERVSMLPAVGLGLSCERELGKRNKMDSMGSSGRYANSMRDVNNLSMLPWMRHTRSLADADNYYASSTSALSSSPSGLTKTIVDTAGHSQQNNTSLSKQKLPTATAKAAVTQQFEKLLLSNEDALEDALQTGKQCRIVCS